MKSAMQLLSTTLILMGLFLIFPDLITVAQSRSIQDAFDKMEWVEFLNDIKKTKPRAELEAVTDLDLSESEITDAGILKLKQLPNLQQLSLKHTQISGKGIDYLVEIRTLRELYLDAVSIGKNEWQKLTLLKQLTVLSLRRTSITDQGVIFLKTLSNLKSLDLSDTNLTDKYLGEILKNIPLETLSLNGISISYRQLMTLKSQFPEVEIIAFYTIPSIEAQIQNPNTTINRGSVPEFADIVIKQPIIVGFPVPFEVVFLNKDRTVYKEFDLNLDIIFEVRNSRFTVFSAGREKTGDHLIEFPHQEVDYKNGILRGEILLERMVTGSLLKVYLTNGLPLQIGESPVDFLFRDTAAIWFSPLSSDLSINQEFELTLFPTDYRGYSVKRYHPKKYRFEIVSASPLWINGLMRQGSFELPGKGFLTGSAKIKIKGKSPGEYQIRYLNKKKHAAGRKIRHKNQIKFTLKGAP